MKDKILDMISAEIKKQQEVKDTLPEDDLQNRAYITGKLQALYDMWLTINKMEDKMKVLGFLVGFVLTLAIFWKQEEPSLIVINQARMTKGELNAWAESVRFANFKRGERKWIIKK